MPDQVPERNPRPSGEEPREPRPRKARQPKQNRRQPRAKPPATRKRKGADRALKLLAKAVRASEQAAKASEELVRRILRDRQALRRHMRGAAAGGNASQLRQLDTKLARTLHVARRGRKHADRLTSMLDDVFEALGDPPCDPPATAAPQPVAQPEIGSFLGVPTSTRARSKMPVRLFVLDTLKLCLPFKLAKLLVALAVDHGSSPDHLVAFKDRDLLARVLETSAGNVFNLVCRLRKALAKIQRTFHDLVELDPAGGGYRLRLRKSHWSR
jgi:hypothetical protein